MAKFIPTRHKKFIGFISYSYKFQASGHGVFLTNFVSFNADKCQNDRVGRGKDFTQRAQRSQRNNYKKFNPQITQINADLYLTNLIFLICVYLCESVSHLGGYFRVSLRARF